MNFLFKLRKFVFIPTIVIVIVGVAVFPSYYFYNKYKIAQKSIDIQTESKDLVKKVEKLAQLPQNEIPTIATVSDKEKLFDQPFFQEADNGDKVLIFTQAGRAILYRPSTNKIIEITSINSQNSNKDSQNAKKAKVSLYNGTGIIGLTSRFEDELINKFNEIIIIEKEHAIKKDYEKTLIIDISKKYSNIARQLSTELSAEVVALPKAEIRPNSDILIIFGQDKK